MLYYDNKINKICKLSLKSKFIILTYLDNARSVKDELISLKSLILNEVENLEELSMTLNQEKAYELIKEEIKRFETKSTIDINYIKSIIKSIQIECISRQSFLLEWIRDKNNQTVINSWNSARYIKKLLNYFEDVKEKIYDMNPNYDKLSRSL